MVPTTYTLHCDKKQRIVTGSKEKSKINTKSDENAKVRFSGSHRRNKIVRLSSHLSKEVFLEKPHPPHYHRFNNIPPFLTQVTTFLDSSEREYLLVLF